MGRNTVDDLRTRFLQLKGRADGLEDSIKGKKQQVKKTQKDIKHQEKARALLQQVVLDTQESMRFHLSSLATTALSDIFHPAPSLDIQIDTKRGASSATILLTEGGRQMDPLTADGGGAAEVAMYALRLSLYALAKNAYRPVMILDEPFRFVSKDLQPALSKFIADISNKAGIQTIIVTHEAALTEYADRHFHVTKSKGVSKVEVVND